MRCTSVILRELQCVNMIVGLPCRWTKFLITFRSARLSALRADRRMRDIDGGSKEAASADKSTYWRGALARLTTLLFIHNHVMSATTRDEEVFPDEDTPLLTPLQKLSTPVPWAQVSILLVLQLAEPLTSQVIYPFTPEVRHVLRTRFILLIHPLQFVRNVGITHGDESRVGYYVGMMVCPIVDLSIHLTYHCLAIYILRHSGYYSVALEQALRYRRP